MGLRERWENSTAFECAICGWKFDSEEAVQRHLGAHHQLVRQIRPVHEGVDPWWKSAPILSVASVILAGAVLLALLGDDLGGDNAPLVSYEAFAACVSADPRPTEVEEGDDTVDVIASGAGQGALQIHWDTQFANVAVERSVSDAEDRRDQYGEGFGDLSYIEQRGNVVVAFANEPTEEESALLDHCSEQASE